MPMPRSNGTRPTLCLIYWHWATDVKQKLNPGATFLKGIESNREDEPVRGQMGSICHFSRALPASIWEHCSQILVFTSIWGTQKCDNDIFRAVFPSIELSCNPQTLQNNGKRKMTNRPCITPPQVSLPLLRVFWQATIQLQLSLAA